MHLCNSVVLYCTIHIAVIFYFVLLFLLLLFLIALLEPYFTLFIYIFYYCYFYIFSQSLVLFVLSLFYLKQSCQYFETELRGWGRGEGVIQP